MKKMIYKKIKLNKAILLPNLKEARCSYSRDAAEKLGDVSTIWGSQGSEKSVTGTSFIFQVLKRGCYRRSGYI